MLLALLSAARVAAQAEPSVRLTPRSSFTFSVNYAPTSGYLFLGENSQRRLAELEVGYRRKLLGNAYAQWSWEFDAQPVILMLEPIAETGLLQNGTVDFGGAIRVPSCTPGSRTFSSQNPPTSLTFVTRCGRITDYGAGVKPLGQHIRFLPFSRVGPFIEANAGLLLFNRKIPSDAGSRFNFQFGGGAGLEFALSRRKTLALDYRVQHISNAYTAPDNSGIDQKMFRVTYIFGR